MKKRLPALILLAALRATGMSAAAATNPPPPELWFPVGEELVYRMKWGFIPIGTSRIKSEWIVESGKRLVHIRYRTLTNAVFDRIYPMNDTAEAFIDPNGFRPLRFVFQKARRKKLCDEVVTFDYEKQTARIVSRCEEKEMVFPLEANTTDIITFMYGMRRQPIKAGLSLSRTIMSTEGPLPIKLEVVEGNDVKLSWFGKVPCVKVIPELDLKSMLVEKGKVTLWVSKDERCVATRLTIKAPLANVHTTLCAIHGPGNDAWAKAMRRNGDDDDCKASGSIDGEQATRQGDQS